MFTSNDKAINYGKRSGLAELDGSHHDRPQGPYNDVNTPPDEDALLKKSPTQHDAFSSLPNYEVDADPDLQRRVRFRPRKGANVVEDHAFGGFIFQGKESCRTPPEILTPEAKDQPRGSNGAAGPKQLLLQLRAALNEKELQLVELREQHMVVLKRCADARHSWEAALQGKDRVIVQLQRTLKHHKSHHDREERESKENFHALQKRPNKQENVEVERNELKVALLEAKNAQLVQELVEQQKIITRMQCHIDEKENSCVNHHKLEMMNKRIQGLKSTLRMKEEEVTTQAKHSNKLKTRLWKKDSIIAQLQLSQQQLQSSLARKEAAQEAQAMSQENVQVKENATPHEKSISGRENECGNKASRKDHLETREHCHQCEIGKLMELKDNFSNVHEGVVKDLNNKEGDMHRIQKRMRELQRSSRSKDMALNDRNNEFQEAVMEIRRLTEKYEAMKHECKELNRRNYQLESIVAHRQYPDKQIGASLVTSEAATPFEVSPPYEFSQGGSTGEDLAFDDAMQDSMAEWEQLSNASVYHANFEKIKITEVEMPNIEQHQGIPQIHPSFHSPLPVRTSMTNPPPPSPNARPLFESKECPSVGPPTEDVGPGLPSELEENYKSIQDEIKKREQCWRKTEEHMRDVLFQQMKLLGESKSSSRQTKSPKAHSTLNHLHHLQAAARGDAAAAHKHGSIWTPRPRRSDQKSPHSPEVVHHPHGHESREGHRHPQAAYEQELLDYELVDNRGLNHNVGRWRHHEHHDVGWKYGGEPMLNANRMDYRRRGRVV